MRKAIPVLGAAGLSLSLASGASAAIGGPAVDMPPRNAGVSHEITLVEEEVSDVSLATFYVFDKQNAGTFRPRVRFAAGGGCGGCNCGGCGDWTNYATPTPASDANTPHYSIRPAHKYTHAPKRPHGQKKS
jgi:hypothetical protein